MDEIHIKSTIDNTLQPSLFHAARGKNRPLLTGLHTWSYDRFNQQDKLLPIATELDWNLLLPEYRGGNVPQNDHASEACGSIYAKQDIADAVKYVIEEYSIDSENVFLLGASGGGHMALLMAGFAPKMWRAVDAWVPITNIKDWYYEKLTDRIKYCHGLEVCCGGAPSDKTAAEYAYRSPITYAHEIAKCNVRIHHGKHDPIVPFTHSLNMYNEILRQDKKAKAYLEIFDGGHEMLVDSAVSWFKAQMEKTETESVTG